MAAMLLIDRPTTKKDEEDPRTRDARRAYEVNPGSLPEDSRDCDVVFHPFLD